MHPTIPPESDDDLATTDARRALRLFYGLTDPAEGDPPARGGEHRDEPSGERGAEDEDPSLEPVEP